MLHVPLLLFGIVHEQGFFCSEAQEAHTNVMDNTRPLRTATFEEKTKALKKKVVLKYFKRPYVWPFQISVVQR